MLKPGQCFAAYEWCITDCFDPMNREHQRIKVISSCILLPFPCFFSYPLSNHLTLKQGEVELGNGLPDIRSVGQCLEALKLAGFEVSSSKTTTGLLHFLSTLNLLKQKLHFPCHLCERFYGRRMLPQTHLSLGISLWIQLSSH